MSQIKSPFIYIDNFLSKLHVMELAEDLNYTEPNRNEDGLPIPLYIEHDDVFVDVLDKLEPIADELCKYYGTEFSGIETMKIEWVPRGAHIPVHSENSTLIGNRWLKTQNRDLTGIIFLCDHVDPKNVHELDDLECCQGKLEFQNYGFGLLPQAGDLVLFPSDARFANSTNKVLAGDLYQIRFHIVTKVPYIHDISKFPGTYLDWF